MLEEQDDRIHQISDKPSQKERQKYITQLIDKHKYTYQ